MTRSKAKAKPATNAETLRIKSESDTPDPKKLGQVVMGSLAGNAITARTFSKGLFGESDLTACHDAIDECAKRVHSGDLSALETVLTAQAIALDKIFNEMARRAALNMGEYIDASERYMRLALKAQGQCRATIETLANVKNPPIVYAKQANIANGPQQINNGGRLPDTHARNSQTLQNELLESQHDHHSLDHRTTLAPIGTHSRMEALGAIDRPPNA